MHIAPQGQPITAKQILRFLRRNTTYIISLILVCAACGFYIGAEKIRKETKAHHPEAFNHNDIVRITDIIDGDEVVIENEQGQRTLLRLLGIRSFEATISDPSTSEYGKTTFNYLKSRALDQTARLELSDKRLGNANNLLGTLHLQDDAGEPGQDIGKELVSLGYTVVYIKYPFPNEPAYLEAENEARKSHAGFWSNPDIVERIDALKKRWQGERNP